MATRKVLLNEDVTGLLPANLITDEIVQPSTGRDRMVVPEYGAFFEDGYVLSDSTGPIDRSKYIFTDLYEEATLRSGKSVWNCVIITDPTVSKELKVTYQGFGGKFSANGRLLIEWLQERVDEIVDPIEWEKLSNVPLEFMPAWHRHLWSEVYGFSYIKEALTNIENAINLDSSLFFRMIIKDIQDKLKEANEKALALAEFYAKGAVYEATKNISKETLNLHLIANLTTATPSEMRVIGRSNFDGSTLAYNRYINKKGLIAFTQSLKERSVKISNTNIGIPNGVVKDSKKGSLISLGNSGVIILESKDAILQSGHFYEENCYPKNYPDTDRFTITRVTHNIHDHGGAFLGFNNTTGEMFTGILKDDKCFRRIQWWKFYSEITYDKIINALNEHIRLTNNPHNLTKEQVVLEKVWNFPVVTDEEILTEQTEVSAYVTLDQLQLFMTKHLLNLKGELKEDGTLDKDKDPFNKPNLIFTPCDKKVKDNWPPKGQILKLYCNGSDRFKQVADGEGGFTDDILELNSDDCNFFDKPKQGEVISEACEGTDLVREISDGRGSSTKIVAETKSSKCGYKEPIPVGTIIREGCEGLNFIRFYADGNNGEIKMIQEVNSEHCGFTTTTTSTQAPTTAPPTGGNSGVKKITFSSSHNRIESGTRETLSGTFTGFPPNTYVSFTLQSREPRGTVADGSYKEWTNMINDGVSIGASGSANWSRTQTDDGTVPRGSIWDNRLSADDGTLSNTIVREFVASGNGATNAPVATTRPPSGGSLSVTLTASDMMANYEMLMGTMTVKVTGDAVASYYYQIFYQPSMYGVSSNQSLKNKWYEARNGVIATNSGGSGQMNIPYSQIFGAMADHISGTTPYTFKAVVNTVESPKIEVQYYNVSNAGGGA